MTEKDFQRIQELLTTSLNATEARNAEHFDSINKRLDGVEKRLDKLEHEIKGLFVFEGVVGGACRLV